MTLSLRVRVKRAVSRRPLRTMVIILALVYLFCTYSVVANERVSWTRAISMTLPTFLGELGDIPGSSGTRMSILIGLATSVAFLTVLTSLVVSHFVTLALRGGRLMDASEYTGHIVICGWNPQGENIVSQLFCEDIARKRPVVILAPMEKNPCGDKRVDFVSGDPTRRRDLTRAGIPGADTAIVLTDVAGGTSAGADALAVMITLAVETLNPAVHTCVQVLHGENRHHLENANVDEVICLDDMGGNLTVATALNHGVATVLRELLTFSKGSEFYRCKPELTEKVVGLSFAGAVKRLVDEKLLLLAVETDDDGTVREACPDDWVHSGSGARVIIVNPHGEYQIRQGDILFVIAESEPTEL